MHNNVCETPVADTSIAAGHEHPRPLPAEEHGPGCQPDWPSPLTTWLRYYYIGRWNYVKGLAVAGLIALLLFVVWSATAAYVVIAGALLYVLGSGFGLFLLYGPPCSRIFQRLFAIADLQGNERVLDVHFGTYRSSRVALERLPDAVVQAVGVYDPEHESEPAVRDVWKFERPPLGHPRFTSTDGSPQALPVADHSVDVVLLGFGIHEVHAGPDRSSLMQEILRVLAPGGKVLLYERGWNPLLLLVFGPLFLHFTPAKEWESWLREDFTQVHRTTAFGMVDLFVASQPRHGNCHDRCGNVR